MRIESKLCHISETKAVVQVNGWIDEKNVGSALAEASTVELAEDKAISRLKERINLKNKNDDNLNFIQDNKKIKNVKVELPSSEKIRAIEINNEPTDWSSELTAIDSEIKRLNWSRQDEIKFLEDNLGYNNRNKITNYNELINYLSILKKIESYSSSNLNEENMLAMIEESDIILRDLEWNIQQGREYLLKEFNVSTRKELDLKQLTSFVSKLKSLRNEHLSN
tara:strand:+ start:2675 stop:3343 length:669 start_codon:yes stop_codon:yes gene_type:complete